MNEEEVIVLRSALKDAIILKQRHGNEDESGLLLEEYQRLLGELKQTIWALEIWRGGELYAGYSHSDPNRVLRWAAHFGDWPTPLGELSASEAYRYVMEDYNEMDISYTVVKKYRGDICVISERNAEYLLLRAAEKREKINA